MKTAFIVAGAAPGWVRNQTRIAAETLTEDGRVLIAMSDGIDQPDHLPGSTGTSNLFGVSRSGYPLWTGRLSSVLGLRRRNDRVVLVRFDRDRHILLSIAALTSRIRRERLVVHDLTTTPSVGLARRVTTRLIDRASHERLPRSASSTVGGPSIAVFVCRDDTALARLAVSTVQAMSHATSATWRIVVQADDPSVERLIHESGRTDTLWSEPAGPIGDLVNSSDVLIVRDGTQRAEVYSAFTQGAALVLVGHPVGGRVTPRFDGAWLVRHDPASIIVAIEHSRRARFGGPSAIDVRSDSLRLVEAVRARELVA